MSVKVRSRKSIFDFPKNIAAYRLKFFGRNFFPPPTAHLLVGVDRSWSVLDRLSVGGEFAHPMM
jgi:hypothetical protein